MKDKTDLINDMQVFNEHLEQFLKQKFNAKEYQILLEHYFDMGKELLLIGNEKFGITTENYMS